MSDKMNFTSAAKGAKTRRLLADAPIGIGQTLQCWENTDEGQQLELSLNVVITRNSLMVIGEEVTKAVGKFFHDENTGELNRIREDIQFIKRDEIHRVVVMMRETLKRLDLIKTLENAIELEHLRSTGGNLGDGLNIECSQVMLEFLEIIRIRIR